MISLKTNPVISVLAATLFFLAVYFFAKFLVSLYAAIAIGFFGLLFTTVARSIHWFWTRVTHTFSFIITTVLLILVFYLFLTPLAQLAKLFGNDRQFRLKNRNGSMFKEQSENFDREFFERPW
jgi:predicted PurR-regulated permease PerM